MRLSASNVVTRIALRLENLVSPRMNLSSKLCGLVPQLNMFILLLLKFPNSNVNNKPGPGNSFVHFHT